MQNRIRIAYIGFCLIAVTVYAKDLTDGYSDTQWGQSKADAMAAHRDLVETERETLLRRNGKPGELIQQTEYKFVDDQLFEVRVYIAMPDAPADRLDNDGLKFVKEQLAAKYDGDREKLVEAGITVMVQHGGPGTVAVIYLNTTIQQAAVERRRVAATAAAERAFRESPRYQRLQQAGIKDLL